MNWSELRFADYILFRLHWTLCQSIVLRLLGLLSPHRLLDDVVNFMLATFVENWRLLMHCNLGLHMPIVVMVMQLQMQVLLLLQPLLPAAHGASLNSRLAQTRAPSQLLEGSEQVPQ